MCNKDRMRSSPSQRTFFSPCFGFLQSLHIHKWAVLGAGSEFAPAGHMAEKSFFSAIGHGFRHFSDCETDHTKSDGKRPALKTPGICRAFGDTLAVRSQRCKNAGASLLSYKLWSLAHCCVPNSQPGAGALRHGRPPETSVCASGLNSGFSLGTGPCRGSHPRSGTATTAHGRT